MKPIIGNVAGYGYTQPPYFADKNLPARLSIDHTLVVQFVEGRAGNPGPAPHLTIHGFDKDERPGEKNHSGKLFLAKALAVRQRFITKVEAGIASFFHIATF